MNNLDLLLARPCPFTFLDGPKLGQRCGHLSNGYRCLIHVGVKWPEKSHECKRVLKRGPRAGQACGKSTKFQDGICSVCRKCSQ